MSDAGDVILEARQVTKRYTARFGPRSEIQALDGVSLAIHAGEPVGIVGESGSGKTTLGRLLLGIEPPTSGSVLFHSVPLPDLPGAGRRQYRRSVAAVFQNPYSSLDPRMRVWQLITEQLAIEGLADKVARRARASQLLDTVGLNDNLCDRYPHQLSGGQRQRVAIARALVSNPEIVILDEATSSLDLSVRAQIVNLLLDLEDSLGLTYVFIAHDLALVRHLCRRTIVMYQGRIVEEGTSEALFDAPAHPYTAALAEASYLERVEFDQVHPVQEPITGAPPVGGCIYVRRCSIAKEQCGNSAPVSVELGAGHRALCHFPLHSKPVQKHPLPPQP